MKTLRWSLKKKVESSLWDGNLDHNILKNWWKRNHAEKVKVNKNHITKKLESKFKLR